MTEFYTVSPLYTKCYDSNPPCQTLSDFFTDEVMESCVIKDQTISGGDFSNTRFRRVVFQNCRLLNCSFKGCELLEARFIGCDLTGSRFEGSVWDHTISWLTTGFNIQKAELTNAVFEDCNLSMNDLEQCNAVSVEIYQGAF